MNKEKFIYAVVNGYDKFDKKYSGKAESFYKEENFGIRNSKEIARVKGLATEQRIKEFGGKENFVRWYYDQYFEVKAQGQEPRCKYCNVLEKECAAYFDKLVKKGVLKRKRGQHLEVERCDAFSNKYNDKNCVLICYLCNNAKSEFITEKEFCDTIAKGISDFWKMQKIQGRQ